MDFRQLQFQPSTAQRAITDLQQTPNRSAGSRKGVRREASAQIQANPPSARRRMNLRFNRAGSRGGRQADAELRGIRNCEYTAERAPLRDVHCDDRSTPRIRFRALRPDGLAQSTWSRQGLRHGRGHCARVDRRRS